MRNQLSIFVLGLFCMTLFSCRPDMTEKEAIIPDTVLANVFGNKLTLSELEGMVPNNTSSSDSIQIINAFIDRWVKEATLMHEAEKHIPNDLNIEKLVKDYRASLVKHNFEKLLIETNLDSTVTKQELDNYYTKNKEQYQLETTILRCYYIKIEEENEQIEELKKMWRDLDAENYTDLLTLCTENADTYMLDDSTWVQIDDLAMQLPKGIINSSNINERTEISRKDGKYHYFLKVFETVSKKEIAPLSFIEDQARKVILHKRKIKLLSEKKEEIYDREYERKNIKIYTQ